MGLLNAEATRFYKRVDDVKKAPARLVRFFPETNLGNGHDGLAKIAKKHDVDVFNLGYGEYVVFLNRKRTAIKMYAPNSIVVHQRLPQGAQVDLRVIERLPLHFNGTKINYSAALRETVVAALTKTKP
jgi:hypothetical protein